MIREFAKRAKRVNYVDFFTLTAFKFVQYLKSGLKIKEMSAE